METTVSGEVLLGGHSLERFPHEISAPRLHGHTMNGNIDFPLEGNLDGLEMWETVYRLELESEVNWIAWKCGKQYIAWNWKTA